MTSCMVCRVAWAGSSASAVVVSASEIFADDVIISDGVYRYSLIVSRSEHSTAFILGCGVRQYSSGLHTGTGRYTYSYQY